MVEADKEIHISYQALKTTVEMFASFNQQILEKIESKPSPEYETNLILGNALLIYELTDFLIGYIEDFQVNGIEEIHNLHQEAKQNVQKIRQKHKSLKVQAQSEDIEIAVSEKTLEDIEARERSLNLLEKEWEDYLNTVDSLKQELGSINKKIPTLELIRSNAEAQIEVIQAVAMLQVLKQNIGAMEAAIITLQNIKLVSLNPTRIRRLLGIR